MALYTVFAWTAIVLVGGAYYWLFIRREQLPTHLLGLSARSEAQYGTAEDTAIPNSEKRKRKSAVSKRRSPTLQTTELITGGSEIIADDHSDLNHGKSVQLEGVGLASNGQLKSMTPVAACQLIGFSRCRAFSQTSPIQPSFRRL